MRIVHVCTSIDPLTGGPANVLARLAPVQQRVCGHEVSIVTADAPETVRDVASALLKILAQQTRYPDVDALVAHGATALAEMKQLEILTGARPPRQ
jgi:hypothetical protein